MSSQTSLVAREYRLQQWAAQIQNCQNRPKEMSVNEWCSQNNISKANYYYRLRCVRQACLDSMKVSTPNFVEIPVPEEKTFEPEPSGISAMIRMKQDVTIDICDSASKEFLYKLLEVLAHVK